MQVIEPLVVTSFDFEKMQAIDVLSRTHQMITKGLA
jgi:hypothetical protein